MATFAIMSTDPDTGIQFFFAKGAHSSAPAWSPSHAELFQDMLVAEAFRRQILEFAPPNLAHQRAESAQVVPVGFSITMDQNLGRWLRAGAEKGAPATWTDVLSERVIFEDAESARMFRDSVPGAANGYVQMIVRV